MTDDTKQSGLAALLNRWRINKAPSAREYFIRHYLGQDPNTFRPKGLPPLMEDDARKRFGAVSDDEVRHLQRQVAAYVPDSTFSNHPGVSSIVRQLMAKNQDWISPTFLKACFVGVVNDTALDAFAMHRAPDFNGPLSIYSYGLLHAGIFTAQCFVYFDKNDFADHDDDSDVVREYLHDVLDVFASWRANDGRGELFDTRDFSGKYPVPDEAPLAIAIASDYFIVGHELAHHLLGDTGHKFVKTQEAAQLKDLIASMPMQFGPRTEHLADAFAFNFFVGAPSRRLSYDQHEIAQATLGSLNAMTALSLLSPKPQKPSETHPSPVHRFNWLMSYATSASVLSATTAGGDFAGARAVKRFRKAYMQFSDLLLRERTARGEA